MVVMALEIGDHQVHYTGENEKAGGAAHEFENEEFQGREAEGPGKQGHRRNGGERNCAGNKENDRGVSFEFLKRDSVHLSAPFGVDTPSETPQGVPHHERGRGADADEGCRQKRIDLSGR